MSIIWPEQQVETGQTSSSLFDKLLSPPTSRGGYETRGHKRRRQTPVISKQSGRSCFCAVGEVESGSTPLRNVRRGGKRLYFLPIAYSVLRGYHRATFLLTGKGAGRMAGHHQPVISVWSRVHLAWGWRALFVPLQAGQALDESHLPRPLSSQG